MENHKFIIRKYLNARCNVDSSTRRVGRKGFCNAISIFEMFNYSILNHFLNKMFFTVLHKNAFSLILMLSFNLIFILFLSACPDDPPQIAGCDPGYHPCGEDSTECCLDTTSHDFVWDVDTFGIGGYLREIQVIDENNIWAVGEIEADSGNYGGAYWNGVSWELKELNGLGISVQTITPRGLWFFSEDNIWFASGSIYHWDGIQTSLVWLRDINTEETVEKIWAFSENNIFFVGSQGTIVNYDGSSFNRLESGSDVDLTDIWGCSDNEIWAAGREYNKSVILKYNGSSWVTFYEWDSSLDNYMVPNEELLLSISSIWTTADMDSLIAVGAWGVFTVSKQTGKARWSYQRRWDWDPSPIGYPLRVRGRAANDIFVSGKRGTILHYNGKNWKHYYDFYDPGGIWLRGIGLSNRSACFAGANLVIKAIKQ